MLKFLVRLAITAVAIWAAVSWIDGLTVTNQAHGWGQAWVFIVMALVFTIVNALLKPVLMFLSLPLLILTLGLFTLVVNALLLELTAWISRGLGFGLVIDGFGAAVLGALVISIVNMVLNMLVPDRLTEQRR